MTLALTGLVALAVLPYLPLAWRAGGFCFDDVRLAQSCAAWQRLSWREWWQSFTKGRIVWYALVRVLLAVLGLQRRRWVLVGVAVHAANAVLLYALARALGADALVAGSAAALFAVHPMAVMTVAFVNGLPSSLVLAGVLAGMLLALHDAWLLVLGLGGLVTLVKYDGVLYWPLVALAGGWP